MTANLKNFERYCLEILGVQPWTKPWKNAAGLPQFLRQDYDFYQLKLLDLNCLLAVDKNREERPPSIIQKHLTQVGRKWNQPVIYLRHGVTSYNRQRLIKHKVPFIVPGNQMYIPMLGLDLRERFHQVEKQKTTLDPSTQLLLLHVIHSRGEDPLTPGKMAQVLQYTPMTMTRAFAQMESLGIGEQIMKARDRRVTFPVRGRELWEQIAPYMRTPVRKTLVIEKSKVFDQLPVAGLTALEKYSTVAAPRIPIYATGYKTWKQMEVTAKTVPFADDGTVQLELWNYRPELLAKKGIVDQLSLYLSLRGDEDERVAAALETLLENIPW